MRQASEFVEELAFQPVTGRLARLLLDQFKESDDPHIARQFTLDEMSTMIGTTPVMVCKLLSRFAPMTSSRLAGQSLNCSTVLIWSKWLAGNNLESNMKTP